MSEPILKRRYRTLPHRPVMFVDLHTKQCYFEQGPGKVFRSESQVLHLGQLLRVAASQRVEAVYVVGGWNADSSPRTEWFDAPEGWRRLTYNRNPFMAVYKQSEGAKVTVYCSAQWFGECKDLLLIRDTYIRLRELLRKEFGSVVQIMGTPARTGLDLLERSLPESRDRMAYEYPLLDESARDVLDHNIGQGRVEMLPIQPNVPKTDKLYILDAVWMYASCCRRVPTFLVGHDTKDEYAGYQPAFYKVKFRVPQGWNHIGLLPTWHPRQHRSVYPWRPSDYEYTSYVGSYGMRLALEHHWPLKIVERWLFAPEGTKGSDPLEQWITKLRRLRDAATDEREGAKGALLRAALRAITLKGIGSMHRKGRYEQVETPIDRIDEIPVDADIIWRTEHHIRWRKPVPLHRDMQHFQHSEWAAYVWDHARYRLTREALKFPREVVIALRTDAIALAAPPGDEYAPELNTKPGQFRLKEIYDLQGYPLPRTNREYLDIRKLNRIELEPEEEDDEQEVFSGAF